MINKVSFIYNFIKNISSKEPIILLGRWKIDNCNLKMYNKIDYSNEDHCGTCVNNKSLLNSNKVNKFI